MSQQHSKNQLKLLTDKLPNQKLISAQNAFTSNKPFFFNPRQNAQVFQEYYPQQPQTARSKESQNSATKVLSFLKEANSQNQFQVRRSQEKSASLVQQGITQTKLKFMLKNSEQRQLQYNSLRSVQATDKKKIKNSINSSNEDPYTFQNIFATNSPKSLSKRHLQSPQKEKQLSMSYQVNNFKPLASPEIKQHAKQILKLDLNNLGKVVTECFSDRYADNKYFSKFKPNSARSKIQDEKIQQTQLIIQKLNIEFKLSENQKAPIKNVMSLKHIEKPQIVQNSEKKLKEDNFVSVCNGMTAANKYSRFLTKFERQEILNFDTIYFVGQQAIKTNVENKACNYGYDNDKGDFIFIPNDHIAYRYEMISKLGKGSFGQVFKVLDHKRGMFVALKVIKNKKRFQAQALEEIQILKSIRDSCESIVKIMDYFIFRSHVCIGFELLSWNLYEVLMQNNFKGMQLNLIRKFSIQILQALLEMENKGVIHCDLKPENILLTEEKKCGIKVIDFGSSCLRDNKLYTYIQSRFYRAPEIFFGLPYDTHIDLWSFGCIMVELFTGRPLFQSESEMDHISQIIETIGKPPTLMIQQASKRQQFFDEQMQPISMMNLQGRRRFEGVRPIEYILQSSPPNFIEFVSGFLKWNAEERLTPSQALVHPWILEGLPKKIKNQHLQVMKNRSPNINNFIDLKLTRNTTSHNQSHEQIDKDFSQGVQGESKLIKMRSQRS